MTVEGADIAKTKAHLKERYSYLHLAIAIAPSLFAQDDLRGALNELGGFIDSAAPKDLLRKASDLERLLDQAIAVVGQQLHPRLPWHTIAAEYWQLSATKGAPYDRGMRYATLNRWFDLGQALGLPDDLPLHAQIGMVHHAGTAAIEEDFLLRDSFYLLAKVQQQFAWLTRYVEMRKTGHVDGCAEVTVALAHNVAALARLTVKSYYAFLECFVNSVAEDFLARAGQQSASDEECLRGMKKGSFLGLEAKIERFPGIIRDDKQRPLVLSDPAQIREPFRTLRQLRKIRDASVHYAKRKEEIWRSPQEWMELAGLAAHVCVGCAREFWTACYPCRTLPQYLHYLDDTRHREIAQQRLDAEAEAFAEIVRPTHLPGREAKQ